MSPWPTSTAGPSSSISAYDTGLNDYYQPAEEEYDQTLGLPIPASHKHTPRSEPTTAPPPSTSLYETGYDFYQPDEEEYGQIPELLAPASYKHTPKTKSTTASTPSTRSKSTTAAPPSTRSKSTTAAPPSTRSKSTTAPSLSTPLLSTSLYETGYAYYQPFEEENDQVPELPTPASFKHTPRSRTMNDSLSYNEDLSRYVREPSRKFIFGTVFKTVWAEPVTNPRLSESDQDPVQTDPSDFSIDWSSLSLNPSHTPAAVSSSTSKSSSPSPSTPARTSSRASSISEAGVVRSLDGTMYHQGIRRFIVIDGTENGARNGNSICVPILTYNKQGCTRHGVKPSQHGVIFTPDKLPMLLNAEPDLGFNPIRLVVNRDLEGNEKLEPESRVHYSKFITIEHNSNVQIIGRIHPDDLETLEGAVDGCWERRIRDRKKNKKQERHKR